VGRLGARCATLIVYVAGNPAVVTRVGLSATVLYLMCSVVAWVEKYSRLAQE